MSCSNLLPLSRSSSASSRSRSRTAWMVPVTLRILPDRSSGQSCLARMSRPLAGNEIDFTQNADGPVGDVLQVADGSRDQVESTAHFT